MNDDFPLPPPGLDSRETLAYYKRFLQKQGFTSLDELNAFLKKAARHANTARLAQFHGLSPMQVHSLLCSPFDSPDLVSFPEHLSRQPVTPASQMFMLLADVIGDRGLKGTAKGNLPLNFCREAALAYLGKDEYERQAKRYSPIKTEDEFFPISAVNKTAQKAGIVRRANNTFTLTARARKMMAADGIASIYPVLFRTFAGKINWAYFAGIDEEVFLQRSFLVTLHFLRTYANSAANGPRRPKRTLAVCPSIV